MDALEQLESCQTLFLIGICEPFENQLQIVLQEAKTHHDKPKSSVIGGVDLGIGFPIVPSEDSRLFSSSGDGTAYLVTDESYGIYREKNIL